MSPDVDTEDDGLDDDTEDEGFDDYTEDEGLDDDDDDSGEHHDGCFCPDCCQAQLVGLATVGGDDPDDYLATYGAAELRNVGREVLDGEP